MQTAHHGITTLAGKQFICIPVPVVNEEGHGSVSLQAANPGVVWIDSNDMPQDSDMPMKDLCDLLTCDEIQMF